MISELWFYNDYPNDFVSLPARIDSSFITDMDDATTIATIICTYCTSDNELNTEGRLILEAARRNETTALTDLPQSN